MLNKLVLIIFLFLTMGNVSASYDMYSVNGEHFAMASNPMSYIIPNSSIVQSFADTVYLDEYGDVRYIENCTIINVTYMYDIDQFPQSKLTYREHWITAEDYIKDGMIGDCDDSAIMITSLLRSNNMTRFINGSYTKGSINASMHIGKYYVEDDDKWVNHAWVEYDENIYSMGGGYNKTKFKTFIIITDDILRMEN